MKAKKDRAVFVHDLIECGATGVRLLGAQEVHVPLRAGTNV
jgi:hypothetical protein